MSRRVLLASLSASLLMAMAFGSVSLAKADHRTVQILDNCDAASFNAVLGPGACVRPGGGTTFEKLVERLLAKGSVEAWRFSPGQVKLGAGGTITAMNRGGEFHTFTEVAAFGGGCVADLNALLGLTPVPECAGAPGIFGATGVAPGGTLETAPLAAGTHRFQCIIHPWQRTTVTAG